MQQHLRCRQGKLIAQSHSVTHSDLNSAACVSRHCAHSECFAATERVYGFLHGFSQGDCIRVGLGRIGTSGQRRWMNRIGEVWERERGGLNAITDLPYSMFSYKIRLQARRWWHTPLIPARGRQRQADL